MPYQFYIIEVKNLQLIFMQNVSQIKKRNYETER